MKTDPKITILENLANKIQPEIITCKNLRFYIYFWLYFVYQNFQNG